MEHLEKISAVIALFLSVVSLIISYLTRKNAIAAAKANALIIQSQPNEERLFANHDLLNLYNISNEELEEKGITPNELLFVSKRQRKKYIKAI